MPPTFLSSENNTPLHLGVILCAPLHYVRSFFSGDRGNGRTFRLVLMEASSFSHPGLLQSSVKRVRCWNFSVSFGVGAVGGEKSVAVSCFITSASALGVSGNIKGFSLAWAPRNCLPVLGITVAAAISYVWVPSSLTHGLPFFSPFISTGAGKGRALCRGIDSVEWMSWFFLHLRAMEHWVSLAKGKSESGCRDSHLILRFRLRVNFVIDSKLRW